MNQKLILDTRDALAPISPQARDQKRSNVPTHPATIAITAALSTIVVSAISSRFQGHSSGSTCFMAIFSSKFPACDPESLEPFPIYPSSTPWRIFNSCEGYIFILFAAVIVHTFCVLQQLSQPEWVERYLPVVAGLSGLSLMGASLLSMDPTAFFLQALPAVIDLSLIGICVVDIWRY